MKKYKHGILGIDQSYVRSGISFSADGKLLKVNALDLSKHANKTEKRNNLRSYLTKVIPRLVDNCEEVDCVIERIRTFSKGFISTDYIKAIGALNAVIVDVCKQYGIDVWTVDTRAWKSAVLGSSKPCANEYGVPEEKWLAVKFVIDKGFENSILIEQTPRRKKNTFERDGKRYSYDNDASDSACISLFPFVGNISRLTLEE